MAVGGAVILRDYQAQDLSGIRALFAKGHKRVLHVLPCGGGKTVEFAEMVRNADERSNASGILVHRDSLREQASRKLTDVGVKHGIIAPGHGNYGDTVHVASVQTLVRRLDQYRHKFLIADEGHHSVAPTWEKIFSHNREAQILGVTATPIGPNGRGLDGVFQAIHIGPMPSYLIREGYLVEPTTYGPIHKIDTSGVRTNSGGDYDREQLAKFMDHRAITGDAIEHYSKICPGVPTVVYCVNIAHGESVTATFQAAGFRAALIHGKMDRTIIAARIGGLADGSVQVLVAVDLISEGTDVPAIICIINLRPTKSEGLHIQQGSRGLRPIFAPGFDLATRAGRLAAIAASAKPKAIIFDHAGNCLRFGLVDEDREWTLEGRKKRAGKGGATVPMRQCPRCYQVHKPAPRCPCFNTDGTPCGHVYAVDTEVPEVMAGDLAPIDKAALRRAKWREEKACKSMAELTALGKKRNYANPSGWAYHRWQSRAAAANAGGSFFE